jgi:DNA-binding SARP family transcriptional activator/DNA-binding HxlR family transcriptional regulator
VAERRSLLIIRDALFHGTTTFADFERNAGIEPDILAARLEEFVGAGLMELGVDTANGGQREYLLTENGRNLEPVIIALSTWSDGWSTPQEPLLTYAAENPSPISHIDPKSETADSAPVLIEIFLLGSFAIHVGGKPIQDLSIGSQRLLVFLALHDRTVARVAMAGTMWPEASEERAGISLRSALSRLDISTRVAILSAASGLRLADAVAVDLRDATALARRLLQPSSTPRGADLDPQAMAILSSEMLPDWYDDWVVSEGEDWRQLRMDALEAQSNFLTEAGRFHEAATAARAAVKSDPLRESAQAALMRAHLAGGNQSEALRVFDHYHELLQSVLGLEPTALLQSLADGIRKS